MFFLAKAGALFSVSRDLVWEGVGLTTSYAVAGKVSCLNHLLEASAKRGENSKTSFKKNPVFLRGRVR